MLARKNKHFVSNSSPMSHGDRGFALFTTLVIVIVVGIVAVSNLSTTELTEVLAGNSIQRSRAFHAAEGGLIEGERNATLMVADRVFSSAGALDGIFARNTLAEKWWRDDEFVGSQLLDKTAYPGVIEAPEYIVEEIGNYVADGGSGIASLDRGGAGYGSLTSSGREIVLYKIQSRGVGSSTKAQAVVESLYVVTK